MQASELMTDALVTIKPDENVRVAMMRMEDQQIRHLPVVEGGQLIGMLSDRDLREYRLPLMEELDKPGYADDLLKTSVSEVMSVNIVSLDSGEDVKAAIDVMLEYGVGAVPVIDRHSDELVGIVSYVDVIRALRGALD